MMPEMQKMQSKFRGCLIGGGVGDALGYAVEFIDVESIFEQYGEQGITRYDFFGGKSKALISDDTQMTLYTANGLLCGAARGAKEKEYAGYIYKCYLDWLKTQRWDDGPIIKGKMAWLNDVEELHSMRAPGGTCLRSLSSGKKGSVEKHINDSKGCGGVMRAAPVGLMFEDEEMCARIGAESAAITHGNALGYLPAAVLASTVRELIVHPELSVGEAVQAAKRTMQKVFSHEPDVQVMSELIDKALELAASDMDDLDALYELGEGWVGDEALAVAVYCAVKYDDDFEKCMIAAVNHSGDSDSTGAIAGNILGAKLGVEGIGEYYLQDLELREVIEQIADDLFAARYSMGWTKRYI